MAWDQFQDWMNWVAGHLFASAGDLIIPREDVQATVEGVINDYGTLVTSVEDIPPTATARPRGAFTDVHDLHNYLDNGGLVIYDAEGNPVPNPLVYILRQAQPDGSWIIYEVWINEESPEV